MGNGQTKKVPKRRESPESNIDISENKIFNAKVYTVSYSFFWCSTGGAYSTRGDCSLEY